MGALARSIISIASEFGVGLRYASEEWSTLREINVMRICWMKREEWEWEGATRPQKLALAEGYEKEAGDPHGEARRWARALRSDL